MEPKKVIIDCDPGQDDAVAIVLAARSPELELMGLTCVAGNADLNNTSQNALRICGLADIRDVPVVKGMDRPIFGDLITAASVHGKTGLEGADLPETDLDFTPGHAVEFLIETFMASDGSITLIPIGPLTNVAMALLREPGLKDKISRIVLMGGAFGMGNVTPSAEFNIFVDPEAARIVFDSGIPLLMVGLDVTHKAILTREHVASIKAKGTPVTDVFTSLLTFYLDSLTELGYSQGGAMHDACAVAAVCDPSLISAKLMRVDIETKGEFTRGRTVCDARPTTSGTPNAHVGLDIDSERFFRMLLDRLQ